MWHKILWLRTPVTQKLQKIKNLRNKIKKTLAIYILVMYNALNISCKLVTFVYCFATQYQSILKTYEVILL